LLAALAPLASYDGPSERAARRRWWRGKLEDMSRRRTQEAVAEAAPFGAAREAAHGSAAGAGSADPLAGELRRAGVLPLLVLHLLGDGPSYGNALMEQVQTLSRGLIAVNPNTMYPLLRRLEAEGLIAGEWEHPERRSRRFYRLTEAGEAERDRLAQAVGPRLDAVADALADIKSSLGL
jgi:PadR family transcriptional regulator PadR